MLSILTFFTHHILLCVVIVVTKNGMDLVFNNYSGDLQILVDAEGSTSFCELTFLS